MQLDQLRRRDFLALLGAASACPIAVRAQQARKSPARARVAFLGAESLATNHHFLDAFREGLKEHGYVEGENVILIHRWAEGRSERFPDLAAELISLNADVIVAVSLPAALAARDATSTIPIIFIAGDPLDSGLVSSLARPASNVTGLSLSLGNEFCSKWLEFLKEAVPNATRVGVLWNPTNPASTRYVDVLRGAAQELGVTLQPVALSDPVQLDSAFAALAAAQSQGVVVVVDPLTFRYRQQVIELASQNRLPAMYGFREFADAGGLLAYGPDVADLCRRAAVYVHKILKGAKVASLPVEQPTKFELLVNLKTAKTLGLTIPSTLLVFADEVIE